MRGTGLKVVVGGVAVVLVAGLVWWSAGRKAPESDKVTFGKPIDISPAPTDTPPVVRVEPPPEVAEWVEERGLKVNERNDYGFTLTHYAALQNRVDALKWLKMQGADINVKDDYGSTPMRIAAGNGFIEVMKWLKEQGADVNAKMSDGSTPMHNAASSGYIEAMKLLKEWGADVNAKNNKGKTPLQYAEEALERQINADEDEWKEKRIELQKSAIAWLKANGAE